jgi:hypothetical protein
MRTLLLLVLLPSLHRLHAQEPHPSASMARIWAQRPLVFEEPADSAEFLRFLSSFSFQDTTEEPNTLAHRYRQVWRISEHGGIAYVMRGDGRMTTLDAERPTVEGFDTLLPLRTRDGQACVMRQWEYPCAMICRTMEYYLEE